jgi:hypothetical protein
LDYLSVATLLEGHVSNPPELFSVLWAYVDETGLNPSAKRLTVAGLVARALDWKKIEPAWRRALPRGIAVFHARDCARGFNEFSSLPEKERARLYDKLSSIAANRPIKIVSASVDADAWRNRLRDPRFEERFPTAYSFCFELCLRNINAYGEEKKQDISFRFAIIEAFTGRAEYIANVYRASEHYAERIVDCAPSRPQVLIPLQVADMVCYEIYTQNQSQNISIPLENRLINKVRPLTMGLYHDEESLAAVIRRGPSSYIN